MTGYSWKQKWRNSPANKLNVNIGRREREDDGYISVLATLATHHSVKIEAERWGGCEGVCVGVCV